MVVDILAADAVTVATTKGLGLGISKLLLRTYHSGNNLSMIDSSYTEQSSSPSSSTRVLQISSLISPVDAVAPPPVKSTSCRVPRRTHLRKKRRTKRRLSGGDSEDFGDGGFFSGDGGGDGPFGGGGGGGFGGSGGGNWNFNRFGEGHNWDESSSSYSDPAFDFVYQVLSWIMLSNCLHFAFKKIARLAAVGIVGGAHRGKVPRRLAPIC